MSWCRLQGSNLWPARYECAALPTELNRLCARAEPPWQKRKTSKNVPISDKWASIRWKALINDMSFFREQLFWEHLFRARSHFNQRIVWDTITFNGVLNVILLMVFKPLNWILLSVASCVQSFGLIKSKRSPWGNHTWGWQCRLRLYKKAGKAFAVDLPTVLAGTPLADRLKQCAIGDEPLPKV